MSNFNSANLNYADLSGVNMTHASFRSAQLGETLLQGAIINNVNFRKAVLHSTILNDVSFNNVDFSQADMRSAIIDTMMINDCCFTKTRFLDEELLKLDRKDLEHYMNIWHHINIPDYIIFRNIQRNLNHPENHYTDKEKRELWKAAKKHKCFPDVPKLTAEEETNGVRLRFVYDCKDNIAKIIRILNRKIRISAGKSAKSNAAPNTFLKL
jgi:hypothetical protein